MGIPYVGIVGADEFQNNAIAIKDMASGEQTRISLDDVGEYLRDKLA